MAIRPVRELPQRSTRQSAESYVAKDVREFRRMGYEVAAVEVSGRTGKNVASALKHYVKSNDIKGVRVALRKGTAYLVRED